VFEVPSVVDMLPPVPDKYKGRISWVKVGSWRHRHSLHVHCTAQRPRSRLRLRHYQYTCPVMPFEYSIPTYYVWHTQTTLR
jgi:hypothetical protein